MTKKEVIKVGRIYCSCCGRQLVSYLTNPDDKLIVNKDNAVVLDNNSIACHECAKDLDEDGLFPEEAAILKRFD